MQNKYIFFILKLHICETRKPYFSADSFTRHTIIICRMILILPYFFLQKDGRMSFTEIVKKLHVSIGIIRKRFNKLIEEGTINIAGRLYNEKVDFRYYANTAVFVRQAPLKEAVVL